MDKHNGLMIGQILYQKVEFRNKEPEIREHKILSFGRLYFKTDKEDKVAIADLKHTNNIYSQFSFQLYRSKQEIEDIDTAKELWQSIRGILSCYNCPFSLEQVKAIKEIINPTKTIEQ